MLGVSLKIALSADFHLTSLELHPERFHALENILSQMKEEQIETLIIAGDLFDASLRNYTEFESLCNKKEYRNLRLYIIPGNHDPDISGSSVVADNVRIFTQPEVAEFNAEDPPLLVVPYQKNTTMGEVIEHFSADLAAHRWILIGHGDWSEGLRDANPYEPGVYMPLTSKDVDRYNPLQVFLGHIHVPYDRGRVHYMGSPCGLNISETGRRRYLIYDIVKDDIASRRVDTEVIYFDETLVMLPTEAESAFIQDLAQKAINSWNITDKDRKKVRARVRVKGYCTDKRILDNELKKALSDFNFYNDEEPDISGVSISDDVERRYISEKVKASIDRLQWPEDADEPDKQQILLAALAVIYGD